MISRKQLHELDEGNIMKKLFLILMLAISTVSVAKDIRETDEYKNIQLEEYIATGALLTGNVMFVGSLAAGFLLDVPGVAPFAIGGVVLGGALTLGGIVGGALAGAALMKMEKL